jgi:hypothetical protein
MIQEYKEIKIGRPKKHFNAEERLKNNKYRQNLKICIKTGGDLKDKITSEVIKEKYIQKRKKILIELNKEFIEYLNINMEDFVELKNFDNENNNEKPLMPEKEFWYYIIWSKCKSVLMIKIYDNIRALIQRQKYQIFYCDLYLKCGEYHTRIKSNVSIGTMAFYTYKKYGEIKVTNIASENQTEDVWNSLGDFETYKNGPLYEVLLSEKGKLVVHYETNSKNSRCNPDTGELIPNLTGNDISYTVDYMEINAIKITDMKKYKEIIIRAEFTVDFFLCFILDEEGNYYGKKRYLKCCKTNLYANELRIFCLDENKNPIPNINLSMDINLFVKEVNGICE